MNTGTNRAALMQPARLLAVRVGLLFTAICRPGWIAMRKAPARLATICLLVLGLALSPGFVEVTHGPAGLADTGHLHHGALSREAVLEHGHSHDETDHGDHTPGHNHGHDPADHSHQMAFTAPDAFGMLRAARGNWLMSGQTALHLGPDSGLERPPKRVFSA